MGDRAEAVQARSRAMAYATPLEDYQMADAALFKADAHRPWFERLRREDPVHYCRKSPWGPYWSITRFDDIVAVDSNHAVFSSDSRHGGVTIPNGSADFQFPNFISMDPPRHGAQRKTVSPMFTSENLAGLEDSIRARVVTVLDALPINETFDWAASVATELTSQMLASLLGVPNADRDRLNRWCDIAVGFPTPGITCAADRQVELLICLDYFMALWRERAEAPAPSHDLIAMLARGEATRDMPRMEILGTIVLLLIGGADTTRAAISGGLYALSRHPGEKAKLRANPSLISSMVPEIIRWQSPAAYMRRTALQDVEMGGKTIRKGDKVVMWYVSGNRDDTVIEDADAFIIDRTNPRRHLSFGFGIHRCVGSRLAEMQLRILWEEILPRFPRIEVLGEPERVYSAFVTGYRSLKVRLPARA